jgi:site-specific recombinase XerD
MKSEKWSKIGTITEEWVKASYPNATTQDKWRMKDRLNAFLEFLNVTDSELIKTYKQAKDKSEWAKRTGQKVVEFYNEFTKTYAINTARAYVSAARAFCRDNCQILIIQRRKISKPKKAMGEHEFNREELAKMYHVADLRDKAILATAVSLGFSVEDFAELPREQIENLVNKAISEKIDFIGFDYERGKTGVESRSHLTPEARDSLKEWFAYIDKKRECEGKGKSKYVFPNGNSEHLTDQAINDIIKDLIKKANITTTGKIRFHLIRKFLMNALHDAGFDDWAIKRAMGKEVPVSDSTYLQGLNRKLDEDFAKVYDHIKLSTYTNKNGVRLEELEQKFKQQDEMIKYLMAENVLLKQSIPSESIIESIKRLRKEGKLTLEQIEAMKACGTTEEKTTLEELEPIK